MASDGCQPLMMNGRMRGFNPDNVRDSASGLRFPASATSYGQLREMQQGQGAPHGRASTMGTRDVSDDPEFRTRALYGKNNKAHEKTVYNSEGIPFSKSNATGMKYRSAPKQPIRAKAAPAAYATGTVRGESTAPAPPPPGPLAKGWLLRSKASTLEEPLPALGFRCSAADVVAAVSARVALLDAGGDADTETAIGIALAGVAPGTAGCPLLMSRLAPGSGKAAGSASVAATECIARLGLAGAGAGAGAGPAARLVLLVPAADWGCASELLEARLAAAVGIYCSDVETAAQELQQAVSTGMSPALLSVPVHPRSHKRQRALLGTCRRLGVQMVSTAPLGGAEHEALAAAVVPELPHGVE